MGHKFRHDQKREDTKPERVVRRILERLGKELSLGWGSQGEGLCDFYIGDLPIEVMEDHPTEEDFKKDHWKDQQLILRGWRPSLWLPACVCDNEHGEFVERLIRQGLGVK